MAATEHPGTISEETGFYTSAGRQTTLGMKARVQHLGKGELHEETKGAGGMT